MSTHLYLDIHVLQTLPPSNVNRDESGRPKTAFYGGVERSRVSSQAWKRATRREFTSAVDEQDRGLRTKRLPQVLAERIARRDGTLADQADARAASVLTALGLKVAKPRKAKGDEQVPHEVGALGFFSNRQLDRLAELAASTDRPSKKDAQQAADTGHGVDVALFGRMVAEATDLRVDASCQVAHALSTHAVRTQFDYFTAVDERAEEAEESGAGMIGTVEFNSSTIYRYATINLDQLLLNLGGADDDTTWDAARVAVEAFTEAFATSMPTGKQNTFANRTAPDAVVVMVRRGRPVNLVGAFEDAVTSEQGGFLRASATRLVEHARAVDASFGPAPEQTFVTRAGEPAAAVDSLAAPMPFSELVTGVGAVVSAARGANS
ncbi:type I-E CRISPR-associated protein Cas7/Cse4/CasC [Arsenicicoccus cauae]|uniref:type I-E CRISPR-associated protein Cas7/Cse4/CasC n=1 Tax=Arsenicicoccus cauae TaxID=2663847 RepID=UPI00370D7A02